MEIIKISFDYDDTLTKENIQTIAARFIILGTDVFITTNRSYKDDNTDLFLIAGKLNIPKKNIQLCGDKEKAAFLKGFAFHFDDDADEIKDIEKKTDCLCIYVCDIAL